MSNEGEGNDLGHQEQGARARQSQGRHGCNQRRQGDWGADPQ